MIDTVISVLKLLLGFIPFFIFVRLLRKNLKKEIRDRQFLMPVVALVYCLIVCRFLSAIDEFVLKFALRLPDKISLLAMKAAAHLNGLINGKLSFISTGLQKLSNALSVLLRGANFRVLTLILSNLAIIIAFLILKQIVIRICKGVFKTGNIVHDKVVPLAYEYDSDDNAWYLKRSMTDARSFSKICYVAAFILSIAAVSASTVLLKHKLLASPFYPVFPILVMGEIYYFLDGLRRDQAKSSVAGEDERSFSVRNYALVRERLKELFADKMVAENTTVSNDYTGSTEINEWLDDLSKSADRQEVAYATFFKNWIASGSKVDIHYLKSGLDLLKRKSVLFNNPFYYDLIPYVSYGIDRSILRHKKVLVIAGRHGIEEDLAKWLEKGMEEITHIPDIWSIGELTDTGEDFDIGILSKASLHDPEVLLNNAEFLNETEFVFLVEPSRLLPTAQVGLNSLTRFFRDRINSVSFCSVDKNCDGLVDALSHILMTNIVEVSATQKHEGVCSYMCWALDGDYWQHRMMPNISRYLGVGTELSFAALKYQIPKTKWYGGDVFPVVDMHWIAGQYYYDLLKYAGLSTGQLLLNEYFETSHNMWDEGKRETGYLTVEDESYNLLEAKREYATRATKQSFINVISSDYLLRDYMASNNQLFDADAKAVPYIVADYAHTVRNIVLRLFLRMSSDYIDDKEIDRELKLVGIVGTDRIQELWKALCACSMPIGTTLVDGQGHLIIERTIRNKTFSFGSDVIVCKRKYSIESGKIEKLYHIEDEDFINIILGGLRSASIIAEEEDAKTAFLGSELAGDIFQKYLPGQFLTICGKYYEMLKLTSDGEMVVRRAADHLNERKYYRQIRQYTIDKIVDSDEMGSQKNHGALRVSRQYADYRVETPSYWEMRQYNDFKSARKTEINGIPTRQYYNKQILRIDFPQLDKESAGAVLTTIALLINETFRSLFAENSCYIVASTVCNGDIPTTYSIAANGVASADAIYIIEDTQMDIGLLSAFERNLDRIMTIICDYLDWHLEEIEKSKNPPREAEIVLPDVSIPPAKKKKKCCLLRLWEKLKQCLGKLFKKKEEKVVDPSDSAVIRDKKEDEKEEPPVEEAKGEPAESEDDGVELQPSPDAEETDGEEREPVDAADEDPEAQTSPADDGEVDEPVDEIEETEEEMTDDDETPDDAEEVVKDEE